MSQKQKGTYYNEYQSSTPEYKVGGLVYLTGKNVKTTHSSDKLHYKKLKALKIIEDVMSCIIFGKVEKLQ